MPHKTLILLGTLLLSPALPAGAQDPVADSIPAYQESRAMVRMRDGARLNTLIYAPEGQREPLPFLVLRTPYGIEDRFPRLLRNYFLELARERYIFVLQDIRGRYRSEGRFVMNRPLDPGGVDETTDTWDTVEWLLPSVAGNNGRVGVLGISYPGWLAAMAGVNPHPGGQGDLPPGADDRHLDGRRLLPQRRIPALLRVRVCR